MKFLVGLVAFFGTFVVYDFIGCQIFPVDENNVLQAPDAYYFLGIVSCSLASYFSVKIFGKQLSARKRTRSYGNLKWNKLTKEQQYKIAEAAVIESGNASASFLQRKFKIIFSESMALIDEMEKRGVVSPKNGTEPRTVYRKHSSSSLSHTFSHDNPLSTVDNIEGHDFEHWCADLLKRNGFSKVEVTPASGDHGVDILAEKDGIHYAIQCKCYSHDLGNTPVQEVYAGKEMYRCQVGAVMTNRYFTSGAKQLAEQTRVLLWDRDKLQSLIESAE